MQTPLPPPPQPDARREHTLVPFRVCVNAKNEFDVAADGGAGDMIADLAGCMNAEANAQFIVRACNSYDALVAALSECEAIMRGARIMLLKFDPNIKLEVHDAIAAQAVAALALASGEESK